MRAISSKRSSKAGNTACAIAGGSSITTARASMPWSAKGCGSATRICSAISAGAWCRRLLDEIGDQGAVTRLVEARSDEDLARLMNNLGGHDLDAIIEAFDGIDHDRPVCFIAYTIKGMGLPFAGHKDNHAGLMTKEQMEAFRGVMQIRPGHEWDEYEGLDC